MRCVEAGMTGSSEPNWNYGLLLDPDRTDAHRTPDNGVIWIRSPWTGETEPASWPTGAGSTLNDGYVVWTRDVADAGMFLNDDTTIWGRRGVIAEYNKIGFVDDPTRQLIPHVARVWRDTAGTPANDAEPRISVRSMRKHVQTTTASPNQVIFDGGSHGGENFELPNNATTVVDVILTAKRNGAADAASIRLSGTFFRDAGGDCVRVGSDDKTIKQTGGISVDADLNINGARAEVRVSPGAAIILDWGIVLRQQEGIS
jgi:hypothetical protein